MLLLLAPVVAMAGEEDAAEYRRLTESMTKLAERNAWEGVERNYLAIIELDHDVEAKVHRLGAQSARSAGDVGALVDRLRAAEAIEASDEGQAELDAITAAYGPVELHSRKAEPATLAVRERPFQPDLGKAIDVATAKVDASGSFDGWLPAGEYTFGPKTIVVAAGGAPIVVDLRKEAGANAKCVKVTSEELSQALTMATSAYGTSDWEGFSDAAREARHMTPCVIDEIPDHVAARFHLVEALAAFRNKDSDLALRSATVSRREAPKYELPAATVKLDDPFREVWEEARKARAGTTGADKPAKGYLLFDGHRRTWRYEGHPVVFQLIDDDGKVKESAYLAGDAAPPAYTPLPEGERSAYSYEDDTNLRMPLLAGSAIAAVGGAIVYGAALGAKGRFDKSTDRQEGAKLQAQANTLGATGLALGGVAVGLGVTAAFTGAF